MGTEWTPPCFIVKKLTHFNIIKFGHVKKNPDLYDTVTQMGDRVDSNLHIKKNEHFFILWIGNKFVSLQYESYQTKS